MKRKVARKSSKAAASKGKGVGRVVKQAPKTGRLSLNSIKRAVARVLKEKEEEAARKAS
jgi:hypothetical protein